MMDIFCKHLDKHTFFFLDSDITKFLQIYQREFNDATIIQKMHITEDHFIPWLQKVEQD